MMLDRGEAVLMHCKDQISLKPSRRHFANDALDLRATYEPKNKMESQANVSTKKNEWMKFGKRCGDPVAMCRTRSTQNCKASKRYANDSFIFTHRESVRSNYLTYKKSQLRARKKLGVQTEKTMHKRKNETSEKPGAYETLAGKLHWVTQQRPKKRDVTSRLFIRMKSKFLWNTIIKLPTFKLIDCRIPELALIFLMPGAIFLFSRHLCKGVSEGPQNQRRRWRKKEWFCSHTKNFTTQLGIGKMSADTSRQHSCWGDVDASVWGPFFRTGRQVNFDFLLQFWSWSYKLSDSGYFINFASLLIDLWK